MSSYKNYTIQDFKIVERLVNDNGIKKCQAIKLAGFASRQSYYSALKTFDLKEVLTIEKRKERDREVSKRSLCKINFI